MRSSLAVALISAALVSAVPTWALTARAQQAAVPAPAGEPKPGPDTKPAGPGPGAEAPKPETAPGPDAKAPEAGPGTAPARTAAAAVPKAQPTPPAQKPECRWLGKRTLRVLLRDDLIAAEGFQRVYKSFGCPADHLGRSFGCAVPAASLEAANALEAYVDLCWKNPTYVPEGPAPADAAKDGAARDGQPPAQGRQGQP